MIRKKAQLCAISFFFYCYLALMAFKAFFHDLLLYNPLNQMAQLCAGCQSAFHAQVQPKDKV